VQQLDVGIHRNRDGLKVREIILGDDSVDVRLLGQGDSLGGAISDNLHA